MVGFVVTQNEFPAGSGVRYDLFPTAAFARAVNPRVPLLRADFVRLRGGAADVAALDSKLQPMHVLGTDDLDIDAATVQRGLRPQAVGWWVLAGLAALAGLAVIGQALARQSAAERADHRALSALGLRSREFVMVSMARAIIVGAVGAAGALLLATLLSPLTPVGAARLAAPGGLVFDPLVLLLGAGLTVVAVAVLAVWPAGTPARRRPATAPAAGRPGPCWSAPPPRQVRRPACCSGSAARWSGGSAGRPHRSARPCSARCWRWPRCVRPPCSAAA